MESPQLKSCSKWKAESTFSKVKNQTRIHTLTDFIQHSVGSPRHSNQRSKRNKSSPNLKWKSKTATACRRYDTTYTENPNDTTGKLPDIINELVKLQDTKLIQRNLLHFYALRMNSQIGKLRKQFYLWSHQKKMKYVGLNLLKEVKTYSWKTVRNWWKKLKLTQIHGKIYHVQKLEELILLKWP